MELQNFGIFWFLYENIRVNQGQKTFKNVIA